MFAKNPNPIDLIRPCLCLCLFMFFFKFHSFMFVYVGYINCLFFFSFSHVCFLQFWYAIVPSSAIGVPSHSKITSFGFKTPEAEVFSIVLITKTPPYSFMFFRSFMFVCFLFIHVLLCLNYLQHHLAHRNIVSIPYFLMFICVHVCFFIYSCLFT